MKNPRQRVVGISWCFAVPTRGIDIRADEARLLGLSMSPLGWTTRKT
jgi:hypothetical protein